MSKLMLHCGARPMSFEDLHFLDKTHCKPLTPTHKPLSHLEVAKLMKKSIQDIPNTELCSEEYGVSGKLDRNCFGVLSFRKKYEWKARQYEMFIGFRHSNNMEFGLRAGLGDRVFVCDNMSMYAEQEIKGCKHTQFIKGRVQNRINLLTKSLVERMNEVHERNELYLSRKLSKKDSDHLLMESVRQGAFPITKIPKVDKEYRNPSFKYDSNGISLFDLFQAFTHINKGTNYAEQIRRTQRLHKVFGNFVGIY
tara:strand:- start:1026 stop:1781 length:756 start_codon:yes stop_codon:yes gene_type:complete